MERLFRGVIQVGGTPDEEDAISNWNRLVEHNLEIESEEDLKISDYLKTYYEQMSSPPDLKLVKEYFEKMDDIETVARLDEVSSAPVYIRTNYLSIVRAKLDQQQVKGLVLLCRDTSAIAEQGRNVDSPVYGKKILRGVNDAVNYVFENLAKFTRVETGSKLEGVISDDAEEVLDEYDLIEKTNQYAHRNLFGLEPVDSICRGHKKGEFWVHTAFTAELKCLSGSATVFDHAAGRRRPMQELYESRDLPVLSSLYKEGAELRFVTARASHIVQNGIRPVFELRLSSGRRTVATSNHKFLTINGWKELGSIVPGDWVAVPKQTSASEPSRLYTDSEIMALGYLLGDGTISKYISLTASNEEIRQSFVDCLLDLGYVEGPANFKTPNFKLTNPIDRAPEVRVSHSLGKQDGQASASRLRILLEELKIWGCVAATKRIPNELFGLSEHQTSLLLGALWSTDGSIHVGNHENGPNSIDARNDIKYYSISESLCLGVQSLLLRLGIRSTVSSNTVTWNGEKKIVFVTRIVGSQSKLTFANHIRVVGKDYRLDSVLNRVSSLNDNTPYPSSVVPEDSKTRIGTGRVRHSIQIRNRKTVSKHVLSHFAHIPSVRKILDAEVLWEEVESVSSRGEEMTYDLEVPEHHSFIVDDIVTHNTTLALNYAYNNVMIYGKNIFYGILEMPYDQLRRQLYAIHSSHGKFITEWHGEDGYTGLDYRAIRDGELDARGKERLRIVARDFKESAKGKLYVWRPSGDVTVNDIQRKAEMFHNRWGCDGIIVDHLGLIKLASVRDYVVALNQVVRDTRLMALNFARGHGVPVLALFQMNRQGKLRAEKNDGRYDIAAISYANEIEKSADVITYTYLDDVLRAAGKFYMGNLKNRDNPMFERMIGKILWQSKRIRAIESGLIDLNNDQVLDASRRIAQGLSMADLLAS